MGFEPTPPVTFRITSHWSIPLGHDGLVNFGGFNLAGIAALRADVNVLSPKKHMLKIVAALSF